MLFRSLGDSRRPETTQFDMVRAFAFLASLPVLPLRPDDRIDIVPVNYVAGAIVKLVDSAGKPLKTGLAGKLGDGSDFIVGYDGRAYVTGLAAANSVTIETEPGTCTADFAYQAQGDDQVVATCTGGTATGTNTKVISFVLKQKDNSTALTSARQVLLLLSSTQYADAAGPSNASLSLGSVTAGSIQATVIAGQLYLVNTDATGNFSCTATNTDDETVYMNVKTASGGVSSIGSRCTVLGSNSASVVWN